ncbi:TPA: SemiSWEET family transporter [Providencia rettgeri]
MTVDNLPRYIHVLGWVATLTAFSMYFSYIPQIMGNLDGNKTHPLQAAVASVNSILWLWYGVKLKNKPISFANVPGVIFGITAFVTAL